MRFEYTSIRVPVAIVIAEMNRMGQEGWRVINIRPVDEDIGTTHHEHPRSAVFMVEVYFERQVTGP